MWQRGGVNISAEITDQQPLDPSGSVDTPVDDRDQYAGHQPNTDEYSAQPASETSGTLTSESARLEARSRRAGETYDQTS